MRRHPNLHASMENAPGPSNANAAPSVARRRWSDNCCGLAYARHNSTAAAPAPQTGVPSPTHSNTAARLSATQSATVSSGSVGHGARQPASTPLLSTSLIRSSPAPGRPSGNVQNSRRTAQCPCDDDMALWAKAEALKRATGQPLSRLFEVDDAALQADRGRMGAIVGAKLGEDVSDATLDRLFGDRQSIGDLFVGVAGGD
jgi:hypothetical protein